MTNFAHYRLGTYRGYLLEWRYRYGSTACRFEHKDYDGTGDKRAGCGSSLDDVCGQIDEQIADAANLAMQQAADERQEARTGERFLDPELVAGREILRLATERDRLALVLKKVRDRLGEMGKTPWHLEGLAEEIAGALAEVQS